MDGEHARIKVQISVERLVIMSRNYRVLSKRSARRCNLWTSAVRQ